MATSTENRRRIIVDVDEKLYLRLKNKLEYGQIRIVFTSLAEDLATILEKENGQLIVGAIHNKKVGIGYSKLETKDGG